MNPKKRITVADHQRFLATGRDPHADDIDLADIELPNPPARRKATEIDRVMSILDELESERRKR